MTSSSMTPLRQSLLVPRADKLEARPSLLFIGLEPYSEEPLPDDLASTFGVSKVKLSPSGFVGPAGRQGFFSTNGCILSRRKCSTALPKGMLKRNQFLDTELLGEAGSMGAEAQIELFLDALLSLYRFLINRLGPEYIIRLPALFSFIEYYVELPKPADDELFFEACYSVISRAVGVPVKEAEDIFFSLDRVRKINQRRSCRGQFERIWQYPLVHKRRGEKVFVKLYEKDSRIRFEVSFRGFRTLYEPLREGDFISPEMAIADCRKLLLSCLRNSNFIFDSLVPHFDKFTLKKLDADALRFRFKEFGARNVTSKVYTNIIKSLDERGVYEPSTVPADERPDYDMLARFSNSENGFLGKTPFSSSSGKIARSVYWLKDDYVEPRMKMKKANRRNV